MVVFSPPGLQVGQIVSSSDGVMRVKPNVSFDQLEFVRLIDFCFGEPGRAARRVDGAAQEGCLTVTPTLSHRLDAVARNVVPAALGVFFVLISTIPFYIPGYGPVAPNFVLMAVFFWGGASDRSFLRRSRYSLLACYWTSWLVRPPGINAAVLVLVRTVAASSG